MLLLKNIFPEKSFLNEIIIKIPIIDHRHISKISYASTFIFYLLHYWFSKKNIAIATEKKYATNGIYKPSELKDFIINKNDYQQYKKNQKLMETFLNDINKIESTE